MKVCSIEGCARPYNGRGFCSVHARQQRRAGALPPPPDFRERFWAKVQQSDGCWIWTGTLGTGGYGFFSNGRAHGRLRAHRVSWELANGPIPVGMFVCHHCDTPACVRPGHLFLGTHTDNMRDCAAKGRIRAQARPETVVRGERHPFAKLTDEQVAAIRALEGRQSARAVSRRFPVSDTHVRRIWMGEARTLVISR